MSFWLVLRPMHLQKPVLKAKLHCSKTILEPPIGRKKYIHMYVHIERESLQYLL